MRKAALKSRCPLCGGAKKPGKCTFTADIGVSVVVIRNVPATVCSQCGEEWISDETARELARYTEEAREKKEQVAIIAL